MKIVFVDNFYFMRAGERIHVEISPHLGLMTLAAILESAGHEVEIFDPKLLFEEGRWSIPDDAFFDAWAERVTASGAQIVGFTALGRTLTYAVSAARRVRERLPQAKLLVGGPHPTIVGEQMMHAFPCFDVVVRYEAESIIIDLVERLRLNKPLDLVPNLVFRRADGGIAVTPRVVQLPDMDSLPAPALHLYPEERLKKIEMSLEAGRGCPFACTFCSTATFFQRRYRLRSNDKLIADMEAVRARYGVNVFNLNHDLFGLKKSSLREFCAQVTGLGFEWKCSMRSDTLDAEMLPMMTAAGCRDLYFGIESGSARMQKVIKKHLDLDATWHTLKAVIDAGLTCTASFITGFPEEAEEDLDATLDYLGKVMALAPAAITVQLHVLSPEPGSELTTREHQIDFDGLGPELDDLMDREMVAAHPEVLSVFYHFRTVLPRWRIVMASAFVTYLLPELGVPLTTHISRQLFGGSLARLFREIVPHDPGPIADYAHIVELLWAGAEAMARRHQATCSYLPGLVQLSRLLAITKDELKRLQPASEQDATPVALVLVARFDCDVLKIAKELLVRPSEPLDDGLMVAADRWYLIRVSQDSEPEMVPLSSEQAQDLHEEVTPAGTETVGAGRVRRYGARMIFEPDFTLSESETVQ
jgi:radical SAM superfamily enzyme YgiQ (UPF0313 family)